MDPQESLLAELRTLLTTEPPSARRVLDLLHARLSGLTGLEHVSVSVHEQEHAPPVPVAHAGTPAPPVGAQQQVVPLTFTGTDVGTLLLAGRGLGALRPDVVDGIAHHLAVTLWAAAVEEEKRFWADSGSAVRRLFEEGAHATSIEAVATVLAQVTAHTFHAERVAVALLDGDGDGDGDSMHVFGVGLPDDVSEALRRTVDGSDPRNSPAWRRVLRSASPLLVGDVATAAVRPGGFVETMQLRSFALLPLLSAAGVIGAVLCGDAGRRRTWSPREEELAAQLSLEAALVVEGTRLRQAERERLDELAHQASHDGLTGLPNRSELLRRTGLAIEAARRHGHRVALLLIDLDGFKRVNDTRGHHAGDLLLQQVATRLRESVREVDVAARLGGDEFAVLLTGDPDEEIGCAVARRIHERLQEPFPLEGRAVRVGGSIGLALFPEHAGDVPALLRAADKEMYRAKRRRHRPAVAG